MEILVKQILKLSHMIGQMEEAAIEQFNFSNLTHSQMHYLETISLLSNPNITELASYMELSKPTVKVAIDKLIEKELIFKVRSDEDRRSAHIHLAEKGKLINQMHDYAHKRIAEEFGNKLNKDEIEQLINILSKVLKDK